MKSARFVIHEFNVGKPPFRLKKEKNAGFINNFFFLNTNLIDRIYTTRKKL